MPKQTGEDAAIARLERGAEEERADRDAQLWRDAEQDARIAAAQHRRQIQLSQLMP
jgi:hypothetical protein